MTTYELYIKDKQGFINSVERLRAKYDKFAASKVRGAIMKQTYFAREAIGMSTSTSDLLNVQPSSVSNYMREAYDAIYSKVGGAFAAETYENVKPLALKSKEDDALRESWERAMQQYLNTYATTRITKTAETTEQRVRDIIKLHVKVGMSRGDSIDVIKRNILKSVTEMSASRARMIARTEVVGASNQGSLIGAQSSGVALNKKWITAHNKIPPRPTHKAADGQTVGLNERFSVGNDLMNAPGDPTASAKEVINCRCTIVFTKA